MNMDQGAIEEEEGGRDEHQAIERLHIFADPSAEPSTYLPDRRNISNIILSLHC